MHETDIAVVGGGISGLTVAHALERTGCAVTLIERAPQVGGRMHSQQLGGFLLEHGPNAMIAPAPGAEALLAATGLTAERIARGSEVRHRYLVRDGRVHALPLDPMRFFLSSFFTVHGRLRLLAEPFIPATNEDETVAAFVRRRFGDELLDYVFEPLVGGLYAGLADQLGVAAVFPQLKRLEREHGSVIRGVLARRRAGTGGFDPRHRQLFSLRHGLGSLPAALARACSGPLLTDTRVDRIEPCAGGGYRLHLVRHDQRDTLRAAQVVIALPAYVAASLLAPLDAEAAALLGDIPHSPLAVAFLGYARGAIAHPLDGLGVLTPRAEQRGLLGMLFSSTLFPGRAPAGKVLLTAYVGGARAPEAARLPRAEVLALAQHEAHELLGARAAPSLGHVRYWRRCLPQPGPGHERRVLTLRSLESRWPGLHITGNYLSGVSTAACIDAALAVAERAAAHTCTTARGRRRCGS